MMRKQLLLVAAFVLCLPIAAFSQNAAYHDIVLSGTGQPLGGATVTVCLSSASGVPCSPTATIFNASGSAIANPTTTDGLGNVSFWAAPSNYQLCVSGSAVIPYCYYFSIGGAGGSSGSLSGMTAGQVPIAATPTTVTSSKPIQGADSFLLSAGTIGNNSPCMGTDSSGGATTVGCTGVPGTPTNSVQLNCSPGVFCGASGITSPDGNSLYINGPDPLTDITAFGARAVGITSYPQTTATCTASSATVTMATNGTVNGVAFKNGDGVTLWGCGASLALATPAAPTVTPSIATQGTGLGGGTSVQATVASGTGSSTYSYKVIYRDLVGGHTAPSAATTITNGLASLGPVECTISTLTRSGTQVELTFGSACAGAVAGARVHITGASSPDFDGFFNISSVVSSTDVKITNTILNSSPTAWNSSDTTSGTGGSAGFMLSNHIQMTHQTGMWEAYVCAERPGDSNYHLIGVTAPSTGTAWDIQFDDYAANDYITYPGYIETGSDTRGSNDAICNGGSALNDPLTTTIVSGAGTTTLVLANQATNNSSGQGIFFDDAPGILAAANAANSSVFNGGGTVYIPPALSCGTSQACVYPINSYLALPYYPRLLQAGSLMLRETFHPGQIWEGTWGTGTGIQFQQDISPSVNYTANPAVTTTGSMYHLTFFPVQETFGSATAYNGSLAVLDDQCTSRYEKVQFQGDANTFGINGFLAKQIIMRGVGSGNECTHEIRDSVFQGGTTQSLDHTWTPLIYLPAAQNGSGGLAGNQGVRMILDNNNFSIQGIEEDLAGGYAGNWEWRQGYRQGGIMPFLAIHNTNGLDRVDMSIVQTTQDTESLPTFEFNSGILANTTMDKVQNASQDVGGIPPPISGSPTVSHLSYIGTETGKLPNTAGHGNCQNSASVLCSFDPIALPGPNSEVYAPLAAPPAPSSVTATSGGSLGSATYTVELVAVDPAGNLTIPSGASGSVSTSGTCSGSGNCSITVADTGVTGAVSYRLYLSTNGGGYKWEDANIVTFPYVFTTLGSNGADNSSGPPLYTSAGVSGLNSSKVWTTSLVSTTVHSNSLNVSNNSIAGSYSIPQIGSYGGLTSTLSSNVAQGDSIFTIVGFCASGSSCTSTSQPTVSWSDTVNTYTDDAAFSGSTNTAVYMGRSFTVPATTSSLTVTASISGGTTFVNEFAFEVAGAGPSPILDASTVATAGGTNTENISSISTAASTRQPNELCIATFWFTSVNQTAGVGWTPIKVVSNSIVVEYQQAALGVVTATINGIAEAAAIACYIPNGNKDISLYGNVNLSAAPSFTIPHAAGLIPTGPAQIGFDDTAGQYWGQYGSISTGAKFNLASAVVQDLGNFPTWISNHGFVTLSDVAPLGGTVANGDLPLVGKCTGGVQQGEVFSVNASGESVCQYLGIVPNTQTSTYSLAGDPGGDRGKSLYTTANVTIPQAGSTGFPSGYFLNEICNNGTSAITATPTTSTISTPFATGLASVSIGPGSCWRLTVGSVSGNGVWNMERRATVLCSGTVTLGTSAIGSAAKGNSATSTCTGLATTDSVVITSNAELFGITGFAPSASGILTINCYPTANTVNCEEENNTNGSITPSAVTVNYQVMR